MCTSVRFSDSKGNVFMGRNLDWSCDYGEKVVVTPRGYRYDSAIKSVSMADKNLDSGDLMQF